MHDPPKYSVRNILISNRNWERYKLNHPHLDSYRISEVEKMLDCCNPDKGFFIGYCEHCKEDIVMHIRCNGKVCSRCGKSYVNTWVEKAKARIFKASHKLISLTIPSELRGLFEGRWDLLKVLQDSAFEAIAITASKTLRKNVKVGLLVGLQTYGQDMKFHPHLHCAMPTLAEYNGRLVTLAYLPSEFLRRAWRNVLVKNLCKSDITFREKEFVYSLLSTYPNGFVTNVEESRNQGNVIKYLARYMRHPPISNSRILFYGRNKVIIRMKDKQRRSYSTWFFVKEFIDRLLVHISPRNFKTVRWYGLYSRRNIRVEREKKKMKDVQETIFLSYRHKKAVIYCPRCKYPLKNIFFFTKKPPDKRVSANTLSYWTDSVFVIMPNRALS